MTHGLQVAPRVVVCVLVRTQERAHMEIGGDRRERVCAERACAVYTYLAASVDLAVVLSRPDGHR